MQHAALRRPGKQEKFQAAFRQGWANFIAVARPRRRRHHPVAIYALPKPIEAFDPVALTMLAVNRLGPATMRTAAIGKPQIVTVPDLRTAEIFRAALIEMRKTRLTDRLIDVVVSADGGQQGLRTKRGIDVDAA